MIIIEVIAQFIVEVIFIEIIGGIVSRSKNLILKLRGIETRSISEIKLDKLKTRYEYKKVQLLKDADIRNQKGSIGVVLELVDIKEALVEFGNDQTPIKVKLKYLLLKVDEKKNKS